VTPFLSEGAEVRRRPPSTRSRPIARFQDSSCMEFDASARRDKPGAVIRRWASLPSTEAASRCTGGSGPSGDRRGLKGFVDPPAESARLKLGQTVAGSVGEVR